MKLFEDGDPFFAPMLNALFAAFRGTAVMSGCEVSATGTSRTVSITAGTVQINGEVVAVSAGSVTLDAGSTFDRYDLVSVNASGSKIVTKGTTKRKCPTQPANTCLLAIVFVPAGATVIATGNVYDARMLTALLATHHIHASSIRGCFSGLIDLPPTSEKYLVPSLGIPSVELYSSPTRVSNTHKGEGGSLLKSYGIPADLSTHGVSIPYRLVNIRVSYLYSGGGNKGSRTLFYVNGVSYPAGGASGAGSWTVTLDLWVAPGSSITLYGECINATDRASAANFTVTLLDAYPFGDILDTQYSLICEQSVHPLLPYDVTDDANVVTTFIYDGYSVPKLENRAYFPVVPTKFNLAFAAGVTAIPSRPTIVFWEMST